MSLLHIHLISNHIPVLGVFIGLILWGWGAFYQSNDIKKFTTYYFIVLGLLTLIAYFTGEPAEEGIEHLAQISKAAIEEHEEAALFGLIGIELLAVLNFLSLFKQKLTLHKWWNRSIFILALLTTVMMARIAFLGGQIRHTELLNSSETFESK